MKKINDNTSQHNDQSNDQNIFSGLLIHLKNGNYIGVGTNFQTSTFLMASVFYMQLLQ